MRALKGFDADLSCRGHKFEVGQTYTVAGEIVACKNGFHAIPEDQHPLAVFSDYPPAGSRYANTVASGRIVGDGDKIAAEVLHVSHEITLRDLTLSAVEWVMSRAVHDGPTASGYQGAATASGTRGAATASGTRGAATASGEQGAATASGYQGAATASGDRGAATASGTRGAATASGYQGAATASGYQGAATASGYQGAATASGYQGAATASGDRGAATASGYQGAATASGYQGAATASGEQSCAIGSGPNCRVIGDVDGIDLFAREFEWDGHRWHRISIACGTTGEGGIKPGVWYRCAGGALVEADRCHSAFLTPHITNCYT